MISQTPQAFWDQIQMLLFVHRYEGSNEKMYVSVLQTGTTSGHLFTEHMYNRTNVQGGHWSHLHSIYVMKALNSLGMAAAAHLESQQWLIIVFICLTDINVINALVSIKAVVSWLCLGVRSASSHMRHYNLLCIGAGQFIHTTGLGLFIPPFFSIHDLDGFVFLNKQDWGTPQF